jgi:hypothetical protein
VTNQSRIRFSVSLLAIVLLITASAVAQNTTTIRGVVTDPQESVVPNATVTITNVGTGLVRSMKTGSSGAYSFEQLPPGDYNLEVEAKGFKKASVTNLHGLVAKATDQNVRLAVGGANELVTVTAEGSSALVNTQDASLGNNIVAQQIGQLPMEARSVATLVTLQPGVSRQGNVGGARSDQSNVTLDGVDINESQTNALGRDSQGNGAGSASFGTGPTAEQGPVLRLNSEAVEEFRVTTATSNATTGRASAAQISVVTKSGSNLWHGAAFEAYRSKGFSANNWFNNHATPVVPRPNLIRHTFGGAFGGPIIKNKAFFFYDYEGRRDASAASVLSTVPLASLGQGLVKYPSPSGSITTLTSAQIAQIFPAVGVNPAAVAAIAALAAKFPANDFTTGDSTSSRPLNVAGFRFNANTPVRLNGHTGRLDFNLTNSQTLFLRANVYHDHLGKAPQFPDTPAPGEWDHPWGFAVGHTWTIRNTLVNNFRYGQTRQAFSTLGDSKANNISLRFIYLPLAFSRDFSRTNPVHNLVDDVSWIKGSHTIQFGVNGTIINNGRVNLGNAFDTAVANPSWYATGIIRGPVDSFSPIGSGFGAATENAVNALIGRLNQYTPRFTFDHSGALLPPGTATTRNFFNYGIEGYAQDVWKIQPNFTLTFGLRYSLWRPVTETNGFETKPNIPLGTYFAKRVAGAAAGTPFEDPISVLLSGSANNASPLYHWDKTNFQPRVAIAWSPNMLSSIFGKNHEGVIRGGFNMAGDYYGQAVAAFFDTNNTLGFGSAQNLPANTFNVTTKPAPLFTTGTINVRSLPGVIVPTSLVFPQTKPSTSLPTIIESSLDENLVTPKSYSWSATFERQMKGGLLVSASYIGRLGRNLLLTRDTMAINNLVDPKSKTDWYTAATQLEIIRHTQYAPLGCESLSTSSARETCRRNFLATVQPIPYFENIFTDRQLLSDSTFGLPTNFTATQMVLHDAIREGGDWTTAQLDLDGASPIGSHIFYSPQYGALAAFSSVGNSTYNGLAISLRERFKSDVVVDFNYTYSHSLDDSSGRQSATGYGEAFLLNPIRQRDNYASSDFDVRHLINISSIIQLPFGKGKWFAGNAGGAMQALIGGWQISNIFRWNTGLPLSAPYDDARWATNWNVQSDGTRIKPIPGDCDTRPIVGAPKLFGCDPDGIYQSFRNARPGETGERNTFRYPGYVDLDMGLGKTFNMPYALVRHENHTLQFRWEVFNVSNTQRFGAIDGSRTGFGLVLDPNLTKAPTNWSNFTGIQGTPRVMQFSLRYAF